jgi:hypothetical protein
MGASYLASIKLCFSKTTYDRTVMIAATLQVASHNWVSKVDPASGKTYYINTVTKNSQWDPPSKEMSNWVSEIDPTSGKSYYRNITTNKSQWHPPSDSEEEAITADSFEGVFAAASGP